MIAFEPTEDQRLMTESVASFAKTLRARMREFEKERAVPDDVRRTAHELGLGMVAIPEALRGAGLGMATAALLEEEIAYGDPAAGFAFGGPGAFGAAMTELASEAQAKAWLAPFAGADGWKRFGAVAWGERRASSQRAGMVTTATHRMGTWELTGEKAYVVNADRAESFVVFAQTDESKGWRGLGAFVVKKDAPGLQVLPRETTLGLDAVSFGGIKLDGVEVDESDRLAGGGDFDAALVRFFAKHAVIVAARAVGLARAAFDIARDYCETRRAFGKPIGHFQAVAFTLADRSIDVDAARALVWRACHSWDAKLPVNEALLHSSHAIAFALEAAMRCGDDAVQLHGGAGFMRDYAVEKLMRDAKQIQLCAMTSAHADQLAASIELGRAIDPGEVLPNAESQSAFV
jgi:alkylation response protein AidB-like acyl-CoA dehydrogenase